MRSWRARRWLVRLAGGVPLTLLTLAGAALTIVAGKGYLAVSATQPNPVPAITAVATPARIERGMQIARTCAGCHAANGQLPLTGQDFGAGGPPYAIYLSQRGLTKEQFRATLGLATLTSISLRLLAFLLTGLLLDLDVWLTAAAVVPACLAGIWVARRIFMRISRDALMRVVALLLIASGASLISRAAI